MKPVAWTNKSWLDACAGKDSGYITHKGVQGFEIPLYALPDTHVIVPKEVLDKTIDLISGEYCSHLEQCGADIKGCYSAFIFKAITAAQEE